jgi:DNA-binding beta-propeller fold protein YncE
VVTFAGKQNGFGRRPCVPKDGPRDEAIFCNPYGIVFDPESSTMFVADRYSHEIRRVDQEGRVTTLAGRYYNLTNSIGCKVRDGPRSIAELCGPTYLTFDAVSHALYFVDNDSVRRVDMAGTVSTVAGQKRTDGSWWECGVGDRSTSPTQVCRPTGLALSPVDGSLWVSDYHSILRIDANQHASPMAGDGSTDDSSCNPRDGTGRTAVVCDPNGIAFDPLDRKMYFSDGVLIRSIDASGRVETFAGVQYPPSQDEVTDTAGLGCRDWDGPRRLVAFCDPGQLAVNTDGTIYVVDSGNEQIRQIDTGGVVSSIAGHYYVFGTLGYPSCKDVDGTGEFAKSCVPVGISIDTTHHLLYTTDETGRQVRMIRL